MTPFYLVFRKKYISGLVLDYTFGFKRNNKYFLSKQYL